jgi:uroporphyrinogen decarboxylase
MSSPSAPGSSPHLLVRAARGEVVERSPVWAMRQAGRWDPDFQRVRAGLSFYEFSENVALAAEASLLPRRFGVDGIILFYDITSLPVAMGQPFVLQPAVGPMPDQPIRSRADVDALVAEPDADRFRHLLDLLAMVRAELKGTLPVLVFAGAPFTVATYCLGTGKDLAAARRFVAEQPATWDALLDKLTGATIHFLRTLVAAGADVYQLFDSWAGMLTPEEYERWAQPQHEAVLREATGVPRILFVKEGPYLERMAASGADVISLGVRHDLAAARATYPHLAFQGNVDEDILRGGTLEQVRQATRACVKAGGGRRHIVNLNHGVDKATPPENFAAYMRAARGE